MHSALSVPNLEDIMELSAADVNQLLTHMGSNGGAADSLVDTSALNGASSRNRTVSTPPSAHRAMGLHRRANNNNNNNNNNTNTNTSSGPTNVQAAATTHTSVPASSALPADWLSPCRGQKSTSSVHSSSTPTRRACEDGIVALSDTAILQAERQRLQRPAQEYWLHHSLHYGRWDATFVSRGSSYRPTPIAARTEVKMSHTKGLCLVLSIDPALLGTLYDARDAEGDLGRMANATKTHASHMDGMGDAATPLFMWQSPASIPGDVNSVLSQLGAQLEEQYDTLAQRPLPTTHCSNPRASDLGQALTEARKSAGEAKVIVHYYARGVPSCRGGTLFLMNSTGASTYSPYSKVPLDTLRARVGSPLVFIADCADAGEIMKDFLWKRDEQEQRQQFLSRDHQLKSSRHVSVAELDAINDDNASSTSNTSTHHPLRSNGPHTTSSTGTVYDDFYFIGASSSADRQSALPQHPSLPSDILTSCLTTPVRLALVWFMVSRPELRAVHPVLLHLLPGALKDKKTPLGQLQWYFQGITECIAWSSFTLSTFSRLFREDVYVAPLYRGYLLAERVVTGGLGGSLSVYPPLPPTHAHAAWDVWDNLVERTCVAVLKLCRPAPPTRFSALEVREWLDMRATRWKYEQQQLQQQHQDMYHEKLHPSGNIMTVLPTLQEGSPLILPNFFHEELRGLEAVVERVTQQSFFPPRQSAVTAGTAAGGVGSPTSTTTTATTQRRSPSSVFSPTYYTTGSHGRPVYHNTSLQPPGKNVVSHVDVPDTASSNNNASVQRQRSGRFGSGLEPLSAHSSSSARKRMSPLLQEGLPPSHSQKQQPFKEEYINNSYVLSSNTPGSSTSHAAFPFLERLPVALQGLLVLAYREKATELVCRLVDAGSAAVLQCAEMNLFRTVLDRYWTRPDLRYLLPATLFIYAKSCYVDPELIGSAAQRDAAIKVCTEVLQQPVAVPAPSEEGEPGAWQADVLGAYATPIGQRLLAMSLLSMMAMHSADGREACHRYGVFQLCCQLLAETEDEPVIAHDVSSVDSDQQVSPSAPYTTLIELPRVGKGEAEPSSVDTLYQLMLVPLFMALLHAWEPMDEDEDAATASGADEGAYSDDDEDILIPLDGEVHALPQTTRRILRQCLLVAQEPLERMLYSPTPVLRGAALKGLSMVLIAPSADDEVKARYTGSITSRLWEDPVPPFECNTDIRLETTGAAYTTFRFLLDQVSKEMPLDEIRDYVVKWIYRWSVLKKQGKRPFVFTAGCFTTNTNNRCSSFCISRPSQQQQQGLDQTQSTPVTMLSQSLNTWRAHTSEVVGHRQTSPSVAPSLREVGNSMCESYLPGLSNLIRLFLEHNQDACPHLAAHARKVVLEEFNFLQVPWFDQSRGAAPQSPQMYNMDNEAAALRSDSEPISMLTPGALSASSGLYRGSAGAALAVDDNPTAQRRYVAELLNKVAGTVAHGRAGGGAPMKRYMYQPSAGTASEGSAGYYLHPGKGSLEGDSLAQRNVPPSSTPGLLRCSHRLLQPDNVTLRAVSSQDSSTVTTFVYAALGYLKDLQLVQQDDHDPRSPFHLDKESCLYSYLQQAGCSLRLSNMDYSMPPNNNNNHHNNSGMGTPYKYTGRGGDGEDDDHHAHMHMGRSHNDDGVGDEDEDAALNNAFSLLCEANALPQHQPDAAGEAILGLRFHPAQPHLATFSDRGVLQVWGYSVPDHSTRPSLTSLARFHVADVLARHGSMVPPGVHLRYAYSSDSPLGVGLTEAEIAECAAPSSNYSATNYNDSRYANQSAGDGGATGGGHSTTAAYSSAPTFNGISGIHFVDSAYNSLLCSVRRTGSVEVFSGYTCNSTIRRVTTFETMLFDEGITVHDCLSTYQQVSHLLHLSCADGSIALFDLAYERLNSIGYGRREHSRVPSVLEAHPYDPNIFAVGAGPVYLYDRRRACHRPASVFSSAQGQAQGDELGICLHMHFSGRYPHLLVSGYSGQTGPVLMWDERNTSKPLDAYTTRDPSPQRPDNGLQAIRHMDIQPYSRRLWTLTTTSDSAAVTERSSVSMQRPVASSNSAVRRHGTFALPHEPSAALFHLYAPLFAVGCGQRLMLYGSPRLWL